MNKRLKLFIVVLLLLILILLIPVGFSAYTTIISANGVSEITGDWDVGITNVTVENVCDGCDAGTPTFNDTSVTFNAKLKKPGDSITYNITIENKGNIDAQLGQVLYNTSGLSSDVITYQSTQLSKKLNAGDSDTLKITITFDDKVTTNPDIKTSELTGTIYYIQA